MLTKPIRRYLSFLMALLAVFSILPVQAFATETELHVHETESLTVSETVMVETTAPTETTAIIETKTPAETVPATVATQPTETVPADTVATETTPAETVPAETEAETVQTEPTPASLEEKMDAILLKYLGSAVLTEDEVTDIVVNMYWDTMEAALNEMNALEPEISALTAEELAERNANYPGAETIGCFYDTLMLAMTPSFFAATSGTHTPVTGAEVTVSDATDNYMTDGVITVTAQGSKGVFGFGAKAKTTTITITNKLTETANLAFDWTASAVNALTIAGEAKTGSSGSYSGTLDASGTCTIVITTAANDTVNVLTLKNFSISAASAVYNVTFNFNSDLGSITVDGDSVEPGDTKELSMENGAVTLVATPKANMSFAGWTKEDGTLLSTAKTYSYVPNEDETIKAEFFDPSSKAYFRVGGKLFGTLTEAISHAETGSDKKIVLSADGTLPDGDYTISSGLTLLIPFDDADTVYEAEPVDVTSYKKPSAYRTLTMAQGADITVASGGKLSLSAQHMAGSAGGNAGSPVGPVSFIKMNSGSSITVNNGGYLYAWGFITGNGSVTIESGGTVYENFQINDFRGGAHTTWASTASNVKKTFLINSYFIQNIEAPMTLEAGAIETGYSSLYANKMALSTPINFIASSGAMFNITSGEIVKRYDGAQDRLIIEIKGDMTVSPMELSMSGTSISSEGYNLPLNSNMTIDVQTGAVTINQDLAVLPGVEITIGENSTFTVAADKNVFVYDLDQWKKEYLYPQTALYRTVNYAYGRLNADGTENKMTESDLKDAQFVVNGTLNTSAGGFYTTSSGANICSTGSGVVIMKDGGETQTHQVIKLASNLGITAGETEAITVTSAQLKNADGSYVSTTDAASDTTYTYCATHGVWNAGECTKCQCTDHTYDDGVVTTAPTCTAAGEKTFTCTNCGATKTETVAATGHTEVVDEAVAATCTTTGLTEGKHCSVCDEVLVAQTEVDALGHTEVVDEAVAPTCTTTGLTEGKHCSVCNEVLVAQTEVAALGHTEVIDAAVAPNCTTTGLTEGKHCSVCGEVLVAQTEVAALGHTEVVDAAVDATCTATGLTEGKHCDVCGEVLVAQTVVDALGHTEVVDAAVAPTCTTTGLTEGKHCSVCGEVLVAQTELVALAHTEVVDAAVAPTCTETGLTEGKHCSVCGEVIVAQTKVAALGHTEVVDAAVAATCTTTGLTEGKHCSVCGEVIVAQEEVAALGHTEVIDAAVAATCTTAGKTEGKHCSVCNEVLVAQEEVAALGHTEVIDEAVAATCTTTGLTEGKHCSVCNEVLVAQEVVPAAGHSYEAVVTDPTCTAAGYTTYTCSACGDSYTTDEVAALGHTWVGATCDTAETCSVCGATVGSALGHNYTNGFCTREFDGVVCDAYEPAVLNSSNVYEIGNAGQLYWFAAKVNGGETAINAVLTDDITVNENVIVNSNLNSNTSGFRDWPCIGNYTYAYAGTFDGNSKTISGLYSNNGKNYVGLVGKMNDSGKVMNLTISDTYFKGGERIGAIVGWADSYYNSIKNCVSTGNYISGGAYIGGIVGWSRGSIYDSKNYSTIYATHFNIGGIAGEAYDNVTIRNCENHGTVSGIGDVMGGIVGYTSGYNTIKDCLNTGTVSNTNGSIVGGIGGKVSVSSIINCENTGDLTTSGHQIGGIAAVYSGSDYSGYVMENCHNSGNITFTRYDEATPPRAGGIVGEFQGGTIRNCYNTGEFLNDVSYGIVGKGSGTVDSCYSTTDSIAVDGVTVTNCYYLSDTETDANAIAKSEEAFKSGEVTYLLNGSTSENVTWYQTIGTDAYPVFVADSTDVVYKNQTGGCTEASYTYEYSNTAAEAVISHTAVIDAAVAPTCTATGLTEGKHCSVCNEVLVAQTEVAALGHTEVVDAAVAATCTATGLTEGKHCSVCNEVLVAQTVIAALGHTEGEVAKENEAEDGTYDNVVRCEICGEELSRTNVGNPFAGVALDLGNTLNMKFIVNLNKLPGTDNYAIITRTYSDGSVEVTDPIPQSTWKKYSGNNYYFEYGKIAAKEMTDMMSAVIYNSQGEAISIAKEDSVRSYTMRGIDSMIQSLASSYNAKNAWRLTTFVDMLNYGAAAQKKLKYSTDNLANALLTEEHQQYASETVVADNILEKDDSYSPGTALNLESRIQMRVMFKKTAITNVAYAIVTHNHHSGGSVETRVESEDFETYNASFVYVPVNTLVVADGDEVVTCVLYDANGNVVTTVADSMNSYLSRAIASTGEELYTMLQRFTRSAYAFLHAN